jgi:hypothetical protein
VADKTIVQKALAYVLNDRDELLVFRHCSKHRRTGNSPPPPPVTGDSQVGMASGLHRSIGLPTSTQPSENISAGPG